MRYDTIRHVPVACFMAFAVAKAQTPPPSAASAGRVTVHGDWALDSAPVPRPHVESHLAVNPRDNRHMIAVAIVPSDTLFSASQDCAAYASFDEGRNWRRRTFNVRTCLDPWVEILRDGSALLAVMSGSRFLVFRSPDGGRSWDSTRVDLGGGHDHVMLVADKRSDTAMGPVYALSGRMRRVPHGLHFGVFVARSDDGGRTFRDTATHVFSNVNFNPDRGMVFSDGSLVFTFTDFMRNVDGFRGQGHLERARTWIVQSSDGGRTFSTLRLAGEICGMSGFPSAAVDPSEGTTRDRVYVSCASRTRSEIRLAKSTQGLEVWSEPRRVDISANSVVRRTVSVAVNSRGVVGVNWFEQVPGQRAACQRVMFAASFDGGDSFTAPVQVSSQHFCVDGPSNAVAARRWAAGGEYSGFAAAPDGTFRVVWPDARDGLYRLRHAVVEALAPAPISGVETKPEQEDKRETRNW